MKKIVSFILVILLGVNTNAQTGFPDLPINNQTFTTGVQLFTNPSGIISPSDGSIVLVNGDAQIDYKAGIKVELHPGFHAAPSLPAGKFHAYIGSEIQTVVWTPTSFDGNVPKLEKFELGIKLPDVLTSEVNSYLAGGAGINPYDPDQISLEARFTSPSGDVKLVYGFYMIDYYPMDGGPNQWYDKTTPYVWRVRFAPPVTGSWTCSLKVIAAGHPDFEHTGINFNVIPSGNRGYLKVGTHKRQLRFSETNETFFAVGQNIAWPDQEFYPNTYPNDYLFQRNYIGQLHDQGGNCFRLILSPWSNLVEWDKLGDYTNRQPHLFELDRIVDLAHDDNLYINLSLENYVDVNPTNPYSAPTWADNPYNSAKQSLIPSINTPLDFFSNTTAQHYYQKRLRYIMARWGYSTNILCYELFNEIDQIQNYNDPAYTSAITQWHYNMASYIKNAGDPHLLTTSFAGYPHDYSTSPVTSVFAYPVFDITSTHSYLGGIDANFHDRYYKCVSQTSKAPYSYAIDQYDKPYILGEVGAGDESGVLGQDIDACSDIEMHKAMWATAFMGGYGAGLQWWSWQNSIFRENYRALSDFMSGRNLDDKSFVPQFGNGTVVNTPVTIDSYTLVSDDGVDALGYMNNHAYWWAYMGSPCGVPGAAGVNVDAGQKLLLHHLKILEKYDIDFYAVPHVGSITTAYSSKIKRTSILGDFKTDVQTMFNDNPDYAYILYDQGGHTPEEIVEADTIGCPGDTIQVSGIYKDDIQGTKYFYNWDFGNGQHSSLAHPVVVYNSSGTFNVELIVTDSLGVSDTLSQSIVVSTCSSGRLLTTTAGSPWQGSIQIIPNPNNGLFHLISSDSLDKQVQIYDIFGNLVQTVKVPATQTDKVFDLSSERPGVYMIRISNSNGLTYTSRVVYNN